MLVTGYRQVLLWGFLCKFTDFFPVVEQTLGIHVVTSGMLEENCAGGPTTAIYINLYMPLA
jgi:hypothetical protein